MMIVMEASEVRGWQAILFGVFTAWLCKQGSKQALIDYVNMGCGKSTPGGWKEGMHALMNDGEGVGGGMEGRHMHDD